MNREEIVQFLLGELTEADREAVEARLLDDSSFFETVEAVETELVDEYVRGGLTAAQRRVFHENGGVRRRERLEFARALGAEIAAREVPVPWWQRWLPVMRRTPAARWWVLAAASAAVAIVLLRPTGPPDSAPVVSSTPQPAPVQSPVKPAPPAPPKPEPVIVAEARIPEFELRGGLTRGGSGELITTPRGATRIRLIAILDAAAMGVLTAHLETADGDPVETVRNVEAAGLRAAVPVAASRLLPGDYLLRLETAGGDPAGEFFFQLEKK